MKLSLSKPYILFPVTPHLTPFPIRNRDFMISRVFISIRPLKPQRSG